MSLQINMQDHWDLFICGFIMCLKIRKHCMIDFCSQKNRANSDLLHLQQTSQTGYNKLINSLIG